MSLVVETGTGSSTAESYISVADADTYHAAYGNTAWAVLTTANKEIALRKAAAYMVQAYRERWDGFRISTTQALDWPRSLVRIKDAVAVAYYDNASVPTVVANVCADLALRSLTVTLLPDLDRKVVSESIGPISVQYDAGSSQLVRYAAVDALLAPMLKLGSSAFSLIRA